MKPLLERKRRARINKCLDELKDIMTVALQAQGENVSKLEKADILELTVRHLHKLQASHRLLLQPRSPLEEVQRFQAGYSSCAQEAASFLLSSPGVDVRVSQNLLSHLSSNMNNPAALAAAAAAAASSTPLAPTSSAAGPLSPPDPLSAAATSASAPSTATTNHTTMGHFTLAIAPTKESPAETEDDDETEESTGDDTEDSLKRMGGNVLKPEAIRYNPNDKMWRPF